MTVLGVCSPKEQVTNLRTKLWSVGFRPVPVLNWTEKMDGAGKRPKGLACSTRPGSIPRKPPAIRRSSMPLIPAYCVTACRPST